MLELLARYAEASPLETGLMLFPIGLIVGSFSTVVFHRLAMGQSIVWPRSHCPSCHHPLSSGDLVPVLSFLWRRGCCRYCAVRIPWRYPAMELASGLLAATVGFAGGWGAGLGVLLLWVAGVALWTWRRSRSSQAGTTLVEVLLAVALLVAVMVPMLNLRAVVTGSASFQRQMATTLASGKVEEIGDPNYRNNSSWNYYLFQETCPEQKAPSGWLEDCVTVGPYRFHRFWILANLVPDPANSYIKQLTVVVTCDNCMRGAEPVRLSTYLGKVPQA
jgi:hypothetical protein